MKKVLYLTDFYFEAKGRNYYDEDLYITGKLKDHFDVAICHPKNSESFENDVDIVVFRNTGPVMGFEDVYEAFVKRARSGSMKTFNEFTGKGDMCGKQYLLDLTRAGYPVIPTIDTLDDITILPDVEKYVIKPKDGADSIGLKFLSKAELLKRDLSDKSMLIQPAIEFVYEMSFYFINDKFEYAMYAPDTKQRWKLENFDCSGEDLEFARKFIEWNDIKKGIQRVDACRTKDGRLLLVELEDLNPYLSVLELDEETREKFINDFAAALDEMI